MKLLLIVCLASLLACATARDVVSLSSRYEILRGKLASEPSLEANNERLFIYVEVKSDVEEKREILTLLAHNEEKKEILADLKVRLLASFDEPLFIYGSKIDNFKEIISGVDYEVHAVGVYIRESHKYRIVQTSYGTNLSDAIRSVRWTDFMRRVFAAGIDKVL